MDMIMNKHLGRISFYEDRFTISGSNVESYVTFMVKSILSQSSDLYNGQIKYYLKIYTFELSLNLS